MKKIYFIKFLIISLFINVACEGGRGPGPEPDPNPESTENTKDLPIDATVKIYFENTLSMDGYINGNTDFKDVFRELLVAVDNEDIIDLKTEFYLINDKLTKESFGVETTKIADALTKNRISKGNRGSSEFEKILNIVLENQTGDVISVVMADFIYSPGNEKDTPSALNKLKTYTKDAFLKAGIADQDIETTIYRFSSKFDGIYYDINNSHIKDINNRPYYYFVIAPSNLMNVFEKKISPQLRNNPSFENEISFSPQYFENIPYQVFSATKSNGRINTRNGIEILDYPRQGNLEFLVALDLKGVPLQEDYLLNKDNYYLGNDQFAIKDIGTVNGKILNFKTEGSTPINPSDLLKIQGKNYTHTILVSAKGLVSEDLKLSLRKSIPIWVNNSSSNDDRAIKSESLEQTKTFGFAQLIEGISDSYIQKTGRKEYFNIKIPVIKK